MRLLFECGCYIQFDFLWGKFAALIGASTVLQITENYPIFHKLPQIIPNCPKLPKTTPFSPNYPKLPKTTQNYPKLPRCVWHCQAPLLISNSSVQSEKIKFQSDCNLVTSNGFQSDYINLGVSRSWNGFTSFLFASRCLRLDEWRPLAAGRSRRQIYEPLFLPSESSQIFWVLRV